MEPGGCRCSGATSGHHRAVCKGIIIANLYWAQRYLSMAYDVRVKVVKVKGECPIFKEGDEFQLHRGYILEGKFCFHALLALSSFLQILARGYSARAMGFEEHDRIIAQCPDAKNTVIFELSRENGPEKRIKKDIEEFDSLGVKDELAKRYRDDAEYYLEKGDFLSAFGAINYAFGLVDAKRKGKD